MRQGRAAGRASRRPGGGGLGAAAVQGRCSGSAGSVWSAQARAAQAVHVRSAQAWAAEPVHEHLVHGRQLKVPCVRAPLLRRTLHTNLCTKQIFVVVLRCSPNTSPGKPD